MGDPSAICLQTQWPKHLLRGDCTITTQDHQPHRRQELTSQIGPSPPWPDLTPWDAVASRQQRAADRPHRRQGKEGKGAATPPHHAPDGSRSSSRRRIWEEPELCPSPRCQNAGERTRTPHRTETPRMSLPPPRAHAESRSRRTRGEPCRRRPPAQALPSGLLRRRRREEEAVLEGARGGAARVPPSCPGDDVGSGRVSSNILLVIVGTVFNL
jgi:hypothetical protein